jgi:hypothetical protein
MVMEFLFYLIGFAVVTVFAHGLEVVEVRTPSLSPRKNVVERQFEGRGAV